MEIFIKAVDRTASIDWARVPEDAKTFIIEYGLRQWLSDAAAAKKEKGFDWANEQVSERLVRLYEGGLETRQIGPRLSPEETEFRVLVVDFLRGRGIKAAEAKSIAGHEAKIVEAFYSFAIRKSAAELGVPVRDAEGDADVKALAEEKAAEAVAKLRAVADANVRARQSASLDI